MPGSSEIDRPEGVENPLETSISSPVKSPVGGAGGAPKPSGNLLLEDGTALLLEDGTNLLLE